MDGVSVRSARKGRAPWLSRSWNCLEATENLSFAKLKQKQGSFAHSKSQQKKEREEVTAHTRDHVANIVRPYFENALAMMAHEESTRIEIEGDEKLRIYYPSVLPPSGYFGEGVLLEFGGRNSLTPNDKHDVEPYIKQLQLSLHFPVAKAIPVLSPTRTFWEKVTLVHSECNRPVFRSSKERIFRHWYDLATLADRKIGQNALANLEILRDVVKYKQAFYYSSHANYVACLNGQTRLVPDKDALAILENDFCEMKAKSMFDGDPPSFEDLMQRVQELEREINKSKVQ